ncbi:MAG: hypothetical protein ACE15D_13085 [Candidatus Eisenbacteria bacterium]
MRHRSAEKRCGRLRDVAAEAAEIHQVTGARLADPRHLRGEILDSHEAGLKNVAPDVKQALAHREEDAVLHRPGGDESAEEHRDHFVRVREELQLLSIPAPVPARADDVAAAQRAAGETSREATSQGDPPESREGDDENARTIVARMVPRFALCVRSPSYRPMTYTNAFEHVRANDREGAARCNTL